ncbi:unnamed protein product [Arabidopsis halleri]
MLITQHVEPETAYITITYLDESASFVSASHKEGELEAVALVHSDKTNLTSLNVPPMGLFYLTQVFPQPPRTWFQYQENILKETWNMDSADGGNMGLPVWNLKSKKEEDISLVKPLQAAFSQCVSPTLSVC